MPETEGTHVRATLTILAALAHPVTRVRAASWRSSGQHFHSPENLRLASTAARMLSVPCVHGAYLYGSRLFVIPELVSHLGADRALEEGSLRIHPTLTHEHRV